MSDQATTVDRAPPQDDGPAILEARKVTRRFGGLVAVHEVDLIVGPAQIVGLIGPNGAGKTTFFNCITGLFAPSEGDVLFEGKRINGFPPDRITKLGIARTFQNLRLFSNMSARENVLVGRHCRTREGVISAVVRGPEVPPRGAGELRAGGRAAGVRRPGRQGRGAGPQPALRRHAPAGDRPRPGHRAQAGPAGRADRRHEPAGDGQGGRAGRSASAARACRSSSSSTT